MSYPKAGRADRTLCPVCLQNVGISADGLVEDHSDTWGGECPMGGNEAPAWNERNTRVAVESRSGGICEYCRARRATDKAHRIGRGVGGRWHPANIVDLCHEDHMKSHTGKYQEWARRRGLRLLAHEDPESVPVYREDGTAFQPTGLVVMEPGERAKKRA